MNEYEEPIDQVVVRFYGSSLVNTAQCLVLEKSADVLIFYILSQQKLGPKLLGVFDGGRIEEYVEVSQLCFPFNFYFTFQSWSGGQTLLIKDNL